MNTDDIEVWEDDFDELTDDISMFDEDNTPQQSVPLLVLWLVNFLAVLQKKHYLPDAALLLLLQFLSIFFKILSTISPQLLEFHQHFPRSLYQLQKILGTHKDMFVRYVACQKCSSVYKYSDCIDRVGTRVLPRQCVHKASRYAHPCNGALLKTVELQGGRKIHYPLRVFCYMPLHQSLQILLNRPGFHEHCEHWKEETRESGMYVDLYDGKVWHDFQVYDGKPFLADPFTYGFMLNIDWFKPCKHNSYAVGAMYLTIMNLPRTMRFKQENVILIGLIPGPKEPENDINDYLSPLVEELLQLWEGIEMSVYSFMENVRIRGALLCVACDIPACRKVCGFLGHNANLGCSKCLKRFPGGFGSKDYSGFDRTQWLERTLTEHRQNIRHIRQCPTKTGREKLQTEYGCRYSVLLELPYFDPIRMTIIDTMHNLYIGTATHLLKDVWIERGLITDGDMRLIQDRVDSIQVPNYVGRIPLKIASSFSGFTADQLKNWTNLFSLIALRDILPPDHFQCWGHFVLASRLLCQMKISDVDIKLADALLLQFCRRAERLYGKEVATPNMHLHCHLKQSLYDYGPIHNFWLFSYERYNGIFEQFPSSNRSLEIHFMKRFVQEFRLFTSLQFLPKEFESDFGNALKTSIEPTLQGSLKVTIHNRFVDHVDLRKITDWSLPSNPDISLPKSYVRSNLDDWSLAQLQGIYLKLYPNLQPEDIELTLTFRKYASIVYKGMKFDTTNRSIVYATKHPYHQDDTSPASASARTHHIKPRPVLIRHFILHAFHHNNTVHQHVFAAVSWLKDHHAKYHFGKPLEMWWKDLYEDFDTYIPIQLLICHSVHCDIKFETVYLMCPVHHIQNLF